jgi:hypothetical protein
MERVRCMRDHAEHSMKYWDFAVSVEAYLKNHTPMRSIVGKTPYEAWHRSGKKPSLNHLPMFVCFPSVQGPNERRKQLDSRATSGIFVGYSISTQRYFVYDLFPRMLHRSRDVVCRVGKRYTAPNAAVQAILNEPFCTDVIVEPTPSTKQSET